MTTVYDVDPKKLIDAVAKDFKDEKKLKQPEYAEYVKTGSNRERAPHDKDWWYTRVASILRRIYINGPVGTERLRTYYGGKKNRGTKPERFRKASGKIIRHALQILEEQKLVENKDKKGRIVTAAGQKYLDNMAFEVSKVKK